MDKTIPDLNAGTLTTGVYFPIASTAHIEATRSTPDALAILIDDTYYKGTARNLFGLLGKDLVISGVNSDLTVHGKIIQGTTSSSSSNYTAVLAQNSTIASSLYSFIGGGDSHSINFGDYSAILGGIDNSIANSLQSTICGGINNSLSQSNYSAIFGGSDSNITETDYATVFGAGTGVVKYSSDYSSLVGGYLNTIDNSTVSAIVGGGVNTVTGSSASVIVGGGANKIQGIDSIILGGAYNVVSGNYSYAAGYKSKTLSVHPGSVVFSDSVDKNKYSYGPNSFSTYFTGGFHIFDGNLYIETGKGYPTLQTSSAVPGQFAVTGNYLFVATGNNQWGRACLDWTGNQYSPSESVSRLVNITYPTSTLGLVTGLGTGLPVLPMNGDNTSYIWRKIIFNASNNPRIVIPSAGYYKLDASVGLEQGSKQNYLNLRLVNSSDNVTISGSYRHFMRPTNVPFQTDLIALQGIAYFSSSKNVDIEYQYVDDPSLGLPMEIPTTPAEQAWFNPSGAFISYIKLT